VNYQLATLDLTLYDASAPHKIVFSLLFQLFLACCYVAKICRSSCGGPCSAEHAEHAYKSASGGGVLTDRLPP